MNVDQKNISLNDFISQLKNHKLLLILNTILCGLLLFSISFAVDDTYTSKSIVKTVSDEQSTGLSQFSNISSIIGVPLPNSNSETNLMIAQEVIRSTDFFEILYDSEDFLVEMFSFKYDKKSRTNIKLENIYNKNNGWYGNKPELLVAHGIFIKKHFESYIEPKTNLLIISISHASPLIAAKWNKKILDELDFLKRRNDTKKYNDNINFLKAQLKETVLPDVSKNISSLLISEIQNLMLTNVDGNYAYEFLDSPRPAITKSHPKRLLYFIIGSLFGLIFTSLIMLAKDVYYSKLEDIN